MSYLTDFLKTILSRSYHLCFFLAHSFQPLPEALKIIVLTAPSYNPHQKLFVQN